MRILHTAFRVFDLERSIAFYSDILHLRLLRKQDYPAYGFTLAFLGFQPEAEGAVLELQYIWNNTKPYDIGNGFSHLAIAVTDTFKFCDELRQQGIKMAREPEATKGGTSIIAFILDPDGKYSGHFLSSTTRSALSKSSNISKKIGVLFFIEATINNCL